MYYPNNSKKTKQIYLRFFSTGDAHTYKHGRKIRVEASTTHPAQIELLNKIYPTKNVISYPMKVTKGKFGWRYVYTLDKKFNYLLKKEENIPDNIHKNEASFIAAFSGFIDAEGHIGIRKVGNKTKLVLRISNSNQKILQDFRKGLEKLGYKSYLLKKENKYKELEIKLTSARNLLKKLKIKHPEKVEARKILLKLENKPWNKSHETYKGFRRKIKKERDRFTKKAEQEYSKRGVRKAKKKELFNRKKEAVLEIYKKGVKIKEILEKKGISERTFFRYKNGK